LNIIENEREKDKKLEQGTAYTSDESMRRDKVNKLGPVEQKCGRRETPGDFQKRSRCAEPGLQGRHRRRQPLVSDRFPAYPKSVASLVLASSSQIFDVKAASFSCIGFGSLDYLGTL